jgi:branched-chain amino acid transport system permease protein
MRSITFKVAFLIVVSGFMFLGPMLLPRSYIYLLYLALIYSILASSFNLSLLAGITSLGIHGFFGIGAYSLAIFSIPLITIGIDPFCGVLAGGIIAVLVALPLTILLKLKGQYLTVATLIFPEIVRSLVLLFPEYTGGGSGIIMPTLRSWGLLDYYIVLLLAFFVVIIRWTCDQNTKVRICLAAIRDDQEAASMTGINPRRIRIVFFLLQAFLVGVTGAVYIYSVPFIDLGYALDFSNLTMATCATLLGGKLTILGPVIGAFILTLITEFARTSFPFIPLIIQGTLLIVLSSFFPHGLLDLLKRRRRG